MTPAGRIKDVFQFGDEIILFKPLLIIALACHALSILLFTFSERFNDRAFAFIHDAGWYVGQILALNER